MTGTLVALGAGLAVIKAGIGIGLIGGKDGSNRKTTGSIEDIGSNTSLWLLS